MFEIIFLIAISLYFIQTVVFLIGASKKFKKVDDENLPSISIIVAARDEEENILDCLESLNNLIYPEDKIEIIIADDQSTDSTGMIIDDFIKDKTKFKKIIPDKKFGNLRGKALAIANALEHSNGEVILTTDADCMVSPTWAKTLASYYTEDVAIVCGFTDQLEYNAFAWMQSVDFIYLLSIASGAMNLGKPLSCIGNNMSYRRSVYDEVGGYESMPFSVTEDFTLLMTIHALRKYKIIYSVDAGGMVTSKPCANAKFLYRQKKRWGVGGLDSDLINFMVLVSGFLAHLGILLTPFFFSTTALVLVLFKFFTDYFFLAPIYKELKLKLKLKYFVTFELYFLTYVLLLPLLLLFSRKVVWKGRKY